MKTLSFFFPFIIFGWVFCVFAEDGICKKCEIIREANTHKVNPYEYYEDYLRAQQSGNEKQQSEKQQNDETAE